MEYTVDGSTYTLHYQELREKYNELCSVSDEEFMKKLPEALHLACVICYLKEVPTYLCLSDKGIIHELVHLLHIPEGNTATLRDIRKLFEFWLKLD